MFNRHLTALLASTAFNSGVQAMARYLDAPDVEPLIRVIEGMRQESVKQDDILKRAPDMNMMVPYWDKSDDIIEGYDKIKKGGETYLPKFHDEEPNEYQDRLELTKFTNVYRDIVESLASKPFEDEVSFIEHKTVDENGNEKIESEVPPELIEIAENIDGYGNNLTVFSSSIMFNGINSAIHWIFVDYPTVDTSVVRTREDEKKAGIRPFWSHVLGRNVYEARTRLINGKIQLSYIRIFEPGNNSLDRVRIFEMDDNAKVHWALYEKDDNKNATEKKFRLIGSGIINIDQIPLVPFVTGRRDGSSFRIYPAMRDAADLQIKLYQAESGLEFVTTMAGYPMLAANGLRPDMDPVTKKPKPVQVGPRRVLWGIPDNNGNHGEWKFIEPTAQSMEFLQKRIDKTKEDLRELGRQPLTATASNLTVVTTMFAAGKAKTVCGAWALLLKDALENAMVITCKWIKNTTYEPEIYVYTDFDEFADTANDVDALNKARDRGDLSQETYWSEYKRRKVLSPEFDPKEERKRLLKEVPDDTGDEYEPDDAPPQPRQSRKPGKTNNPKNPPGK